MPVLSMDRNTIGENKASDTQVYKIKEKQGCRRIKVNLHGLNGADKILAECIDTSVVNG
jgi:hypothetical protein